MQRVQSIRSCDCVHQTQRVQSARKEEKRWFRVMRSRCSRSQGAFAQDSSVDLLNIGLSKNTVQYLFKPVHKRCNSSKIYKGVVDCRVPKKDNSGRDRNEHFPLSSCAC